MLTRRKGLKLSGAALLSGAAFGLSGCSDTSTSVKTKRETIDSSRLSLKAWEGEALGAPASIKLYVAHNKKYSNHGIYASDDEIDNIFKGAQAEIDRLTKIFSLYDPNSELSRLNKNGTLENASTELLSVLQTAKMVSQLTNGAFDITVQSLWKTAEFLQRNKVSQQDERQLWKDAYGLVHYEYVVVKGRQISFSTPDVSITLNGIAQGYITDKIKEFLSKSGAPSGLVNIGEFRAFGQHSWEVAVQDPNNVFDTIDIVSLRNLSLATSSTKGGYFNEHLSHIFKPRTGLEEPEFISATVVHESAAMADALSTAFTLMDENSIRRVWRHIGQDILLVRPTGELVKLEFPH